MEKWENNRAWFLVLPVFVIVAFSAIIPLMTVVNYSVQDIFGPGSAFSSAPNGSRDADRPAPARRLGAPAHFSPAWCC
jgi:ABC-type sugar transport system permease subunit